MSAEIAHFQNFAKLKDTSLAFNDITVLAGKPSTGKSFVMKFMYAIDESIVLYGKSNEGELKFMEELRDRIKSLSRDEADIEIKNMLKRFAKIDKELPKEIKLITKNLLSSIFIDLNQISNKFSVTSSLIEIQYENKVYKINLSNKDKKIISNSSIFVETPLILEFKKFMKREKGKIPYHIESLLNILDTDYSFTDEEQDKFIKDFTKKSKAIIGGDIESSGDSFIFNQEGAQNYDILNASSGTKSIGLLQYLVTNQALKKGSVLYWEEPEVHLHPAWQLKMVDLFVELMNAGVKIVFSTHSPYMADYLNAISKKQKFRDRISFNVLDEKDGVVTNHILDDDNWNILQKELMDTFEDILWQYL